MRDFQVTAEHIDTEPLGLRHHLAHELFRGRRMHGLRVEVLVESSDHEKRFAVQEQLSLATLKCAKAEPSAAPVTNRAFQRDLDIV